MALLPAFYKKKLIFLILIVALIFVGNVAASANNKIENNNEPALVNHTQVMKQQKTFKKDLKNNITHLDLEKVTTIPPESNDHTEKLIVIDEKSVIETAGKAAEQQGKKGHQTPVDQKGIGKTNLVTVAPAQTLSDNVVKQNQPKEEEFLINDDDDISDSLKTIFYFFSIMSFGAIIFISFKIYRLRLSRAERKYGVQGDRTTQELTPLPVSIEDGHSDDEDQTLFEVQRQNIRIL